MVRPAWRYFDLENAADHDLVTRDHDLFFREHSRRVIIDEAQEDPRLFRQPDGRLPAIVMSHGWGGTKAGLVRNAVRFAADGFVALAFDHRGWGESDGKLVVIGNMPERDEDGVVQVSAREIRRVIDPIDQTLDIRRAFDFIEGEPSVDLDRLGYWGSSYSGAHARPGGRQRAPRRLRGQVAAADSLDLARTSWRDSGIDVVEHATSAPTRPRAARSDAGPRASRKHLEPLSPGARRRWDRPASHGGRERSTRRRPRRAAAPNRR